MTLATPPHHRLRLRRLLLAGVTGVIATITWFGTSDPAGAAPAPAGIEGDHHSSTVVERAQAALAANDRFAASGTPGDFVAYLAARDATADAVAWEMRLDAATLRAAWARADLDHQEAVLAALSQLGVEYRYATSEPGVGFDCSGLTAYAWGRAGVQLTRQSTAQIQAATPREASSAVAGDLLQYPGHVMMYLGVEGAIVHASNPSTDVELSFTSRSARFGDPAA